MRMVLFPLRINCLKSARFYSLSTVLFVSEKTARGIAGGLTCGPHCVQRQWLNGLVCSCLIVKNMFVKVKTKEYYFVYC